MQTFALASLAFLVTLAACGPSSEDQGAREVIVRDQLSQDSLLLTITGTRAGPVTRASTHSSLRDSLGAGNARLDTLEGEALEVVTILFPDDSTRRAYVVWGDTIALGSPVSVRVYERTSVWRFPLGLRLNLPLDSLEAINEMPFSFSGFGWEAGGLVNPEGGQLGRAGGPGLKLWVFLQPTCSPSLTEAEEAPLYGEGKVVSSSNSAARSLCPRVGLIEVFFRGG